MICSSLHRLIELRQLPTNFFVVGLRVQEATGIPNSGYRYIQFGKHGRITLRYDALRQKASLKAVVTTSVHRPLQYCTRQANSVPILFREDLLKVGDVVEQFADNGVALREFYEVAYWELVYKPCRKEYTRDRVFTECTPCISVGMLPINQATQKMVCVVTEAAQLAQFRKVQHPFRGFVMKEYPQMLFATGDKRRDLVRTGSAILRAVVQFTCTTPPSMWKALLLDYERTYKKYFTTDVIDEIEDYCSLLQLPLPWIDKIMETLQYWCPELIPTVLIPRVQRRAIKRRNTEA